jgi:hypothetical protein
MPGDDGPGCCGTPVRTKSFPSGAVHALGMDSPLLFRPAHDDELVPALRLAGVDLFVLADVADEEPVACALVRGIGGESFEVCGIAQRPSLAEDVTPRLLAGVADWLRARGARTLGGVEL